MEGLLLSIDETRIIAGRSAQQAAEPNEHVYDSDAAEIRRFTSQERIINDKHNMW